MGVRDSAFLNDSVSEVNLSPLAPVLLHMSAVVTMRKRPMNRAHVLSLLAAALAVPAVSSTASAQCDPDAVFCAEVEVSGSVQVGGGGGGTVVVDAPPPPPPPQRRGRRGRVLVVRPAPPAPPPQRVVVQPAPPPPPQTTETVVVIEQDAPQVQLRRQRGLMSQKFGLSARIGSMISEQVRMGGLQLGLRFRPSRIFGIELGAGAYGGTDYNGMDRAEVPFTLDFMFWLPRQSRVQAYLLGGFNVSYAHVEGFHEGYGRYMNNDYAYVGGQAGLGIEWRVHRRFALSMDIRAFIRSRVDDEDGLQAEFYDPETGRTTDTSAGAIGSLGAHLYF